LNLETVNPFFTTHLSKTHFNFNLAFLCLFLSNGQFHQYFSNKIFMHLLIPPCLASLNLVNLMTITKLGEGHTLWNSAVCNVTVTVAGIHSFIICCKYRY
jgi:hypothetical protein